MLFTDWRRSLQNRTRSSNDRRRRKPRRQHPRRRSFEPLEDRRLLAPMTFTVTDASDADAGSLRAAITASNANAPGAGMFNTIDFAIPGAGSHIIEPATALPIITQSVTIDGYSQSGALANDQTNSDDAALQIELEGGAISAANVSGLAIAANGCTVRGLVISGFAHGIALVAGASGNTIEGNFIGTDVSGTIAAPNQNEGVGIFSGASNNVIGGTTVAARNVLSGNANEGVGIFDSGTSGNQVEGNFIGIAVDGNTALANQVRGVFIANAASNNVIGGTAAGAGNVVSGNGAFGVLIFGKDSSGNVTTGNLVEGDILGANAAGTAPAPNPFGAFIGGGATGNTIGGTVTAAGNVIADNTVAGVGLSDGGTNNNRVLGNLIEGNLDGVKIQLGASGNVVGSLGVGAFGGRNTISGNLNDGVLITDPGTIGNVVQSNFIGTNTGATALDPNGLDGVAIQAGASNNIIGGAFASGNKQNGVAISDLGDPGTAGTTGNQVASNYIGVDFHGFNALPNGADGVLISNGAWKNTVGGYMTVGAATVPVGNVISANSRNGIEIDNGSYDVVQGNYIGTNAAGTGALGNAELGIKLFLAGGTIIGGTAAGDRNVVSGNLGGGIYIVGEGGDLVQGNYIGTNAAGDSALANGVGVLIDPGTGGVQDVTIGGTAAGAGNLISGNQADGIQIYGLLASNIQVQGNKIGTDVTGTAPLGNLVGVTIDEASDNTIGGVVNGAGNIIAFNTDIGVALENTPGALAGATGNSILSNSIFSNGEPSAYAGIYLFFSNHSQNYPVLISAVGHADGTTTLRGLFKSTPNTNYRLEFFANPAADPSGFGEGQTFLDAVGVTTDGFGHASFTVTLGFLPVGTSLTATATDLTTNVGDTSQFSNDIQVANHTPTLANISPSATVEGPFTLIVNGGNFAVDAVVSLGGTPLATTFINAGQLQAAVPASLAEEAADLITVSNPGPEGGTSSGLPLAVRDAPLSASGPVTQDGGLPETLAATEGGVFSGLVATFTDAGGPEPAANYSAIVDWGDGNSSQATLFAAGGGFNVLASHSYEEEGAYQAVTTIVDGGGARATAVSPVNVVDGALFGVSKTPTFTEGAALLRTVASFEDADPKGAVGDYTASIDWGDGQSTSGTIVANGAIFDVNALHQYAADGTYSITVVAQDAGGALATIDSTAAVADSLAAKPVALNVIGNKSFGPATVATFTDADNSKPLASDYTATITWDDGTTTSGTFYVQGSGVGATFSVLGTHHFASFSGYHTISVAITDLDDGGVTTVTDSVLDPPGLTPNQIYVLNAYQDAFGAAGATTTMVAGASLADWAAKLDAGASHASFATALLHSDEYYGSIVGAVYQKYLGRAPDDGGLAYWVGQLRQGITDEQLEASFAGAAEFYQHAGGSDTGWVGAMYLDILGRAADAAGVAYWTGQLAQGADRAAVAHGFAASPEREAQRVGDDYFADLGRAADTAGQAYWVNAFEHGMHNEDVIAGFLASDEYYLAHSS